LYWLFVSVFDSMIVHIQDAKSPKQAWDTLVKMYNTNTQARKMQLKQELHNLQKNKMNINDYSTKVKNLADVLASIGAPVDDEDLVAIILNGLGKDYSQFRTSIAVRETFPNFQDLITLLISEEMRIIGTSNGGSQESAFYSNTNRGRGRGGKTSFRSQHGSSHGGHHQHEGQAHGGERRNFGGRGSRGSCGSHGGSHRGQQLNSDSNCYYCRKLGHMAKNCYERKHDARNGKLQQGNYASTSNQGDEQLFVMQHMTNSMIGGVLNNNVWYVDSGASNHMTSHGEWFRDIKDLKTPGFVETGDDTAHPITQIGKVPLSM